jgi:hypothetical protein
MDKVWGSISLFLQEVRGQVPRKIPRQNRVIIQDLREQYQILKLEVETNEHALFPYSFL